MNFNRAAEMQASDLALLERKNADYGNANILTTGIYGVGVRLQDKVARLLNLTDGNRVAQVKGETIEDTLGDISNYGLIGRLLLEGQVGPATGAPTAPVASSAVSSRTQEGHAYGRMAYLAGPIDHVTHDVAMGWRDSVTDLLYSHQWATFNPAGSVGNGPFAPGRAVQMCRAAIQICDILIAHLPPDTKAFGTIREIEYAKAIGKPVVVWSEWTATSLFSCDVPTLADLTDVIDWVKQQ